MNFLESLQNINSLPQIVDNVGNILQLHQKLYDLKLEEDTSMKAHIDKLLTIAY